MTVLQRAWYEDQAVTTKPIWHSMSTNIHHANHAPIQARSGVLRDDTSTYRNARLNFDIPDALLAEVDFKWMMAGQGYRVDPNRFYADQPYTMDLLQTGLRSESPAMRECAAHLLEKIEDASRVHRPHDSDLELALNDAEFSPGPRPVRSLLNGRTAEARRQTNQSDRF